MQKNRVSFPVLLIWLLLPLLFCCTKEAAKVIPNLSVYVTSITTTTATGGGQISNDGGAEVTVRGVCWSTSQNPTTADNKTSTGTGEGSFNSLITGLTPSTTYYLRAYATNSIGTAYSNEISFITAKVSLGDSYQGGKNILYR